MHGAIQVKMIMYRLFFQFQEIYSFLLTFGHLTHSVVAKTHPHMYDTEETHCM